MHGLATATLNLTQGLLQLPCVYFSMQSIAFSSFFSYANRAKNIKNNARINEDPKDAMLREFQKEIMHLKQLLEEGM
jgi:hypothetical protein